ncbi:MAG: hypothetical protein R3B45_13905 [Bdellovibrionota bacterium]
MTSGLEKILEKIREDPSRNILYNRYLALLADISSEVEKARYTIELARVYLESEPKKSMQLANLVFQADRENVDALYIIARSLENLGRFEKADVIHNEISAIRQKRENQSIGRRGQFAELPVYVPKSNIDTGKDKYGISGGGSGGSDIVGQEGKSVKYEIGSNVAPSRPIKVDPINSRPRFVYSDDTFAEKKIPDYGKGEPQGKKMMSLDFPELISEPMAEKTSHQDIRFSEVSVEWHQSDVRGKERKEINKSDNDQGDDVRNSSKDLEERSLLESGKTLFSDESIAAMDLHFKGIEPSDYYNELEGKQKDVEDKDFGQRAGFEVESSELLANHEVSKLFTIEPMSIDNRVASNEVPNDETPQRNIEAVEQTLLKNRHDSSGIDQFKKDARVVWSIEEEGEKNKSRQSFEDNKQHTLRSDSVDFNHRISNQDENFEKTVLQGSIEHTIKNEKRRIPTTEVHQLSSSNNELRIQDVLAAVFSELARIMPKFNPRYDKTAGLKSKQNITFPPALVEGLMKKISVSQEGFLNWEVIQALWGRTPNKAGGEILAKLPLTQENPGCWGIYLDCLLAAGYARKAQYEIWKTLTAKRSLLGKGSLEAAAFYLGNAGVDRLCVG